MANGPDRIFPKVYKEIAKSVKKILPFIHIQIPTALKVVLYEIEPHYEGMGHRVNGMEVIPVSRLYYYLKK